MPDPGYCAHQYKFGSAHERQHSARSIARPKLSSEFFLERWPMCPFQSGSVLAGIENEFDGAFTMLHMAR